MGPFEQHLPLKADIGEAALLPLNFSPGAESTLGWAVSLREGQRREAEGPGAPDTGRHLSTCLSACLAACLLPFLVSSIYLSASLSLCLFIYHLSLCVSELPTAFAPSPTFQRNPDVSAASRALPFLPQLEKATRVLEPVLASANWSQDPGLRRILQSCSKIIIINDHGDGHPVSTPLHSAHVF